MNKNKFRILIVEDDSHVRESLANIMQRRGYDTIGVKNGQEALEKLSRQSFDLTMLDIKLPDIDGTDLLAKMQKSKPNMKKIIITGYPSLDNAIKSLNLGADSYLMKPVETKELLKIVQEKLQKKEEKETTEGYIKERVGSIDEVNKKIIFELQKNGRMHVSLISNKLGMSDVAVKKRLDKLLNSEIIHIFANLNVEILKVKIAVLFIEVKDLSTIRELASSLKKCPRTIFFSGLMASSLLILLFGEDLTTLESVIGTCSAKVKEGVMHSDVYFASLPIYPKFLPIKIFPKNEFEKSPCGMKCDSCEAFKNKLCLGCPSSKYYRGPL